MLKVRAKAEKDVPASIEHLPMRLRKKIVEDDKEENTTIHMSPGANDHPKYTREKKEGAQRLPINTDSSFGLQRTNIPGILRIDKPVKVAPQSSKSTKVTANCCASECSSGPKWFKLISTKDIACAKELPTLHDQIIRIIQEKSLLQNWSKLSYLRKKVQDIFAQILSTNLRFCCEQSVESYVWKLLYYSVFEYFKTLANRKENHLDEWQNRSLELISDGLSFYNGLMDILNRKYLQHKSAGDKFKTIAKVSAQKILINLGDLCRYKQKLLKSNNFFEAKSFYEQAQSLLPSNGIPYNQLAILSLYMRKKLDAFYYHMRSLMASNPVESSRESLHVLFDEIRKRHEDKDWKSVPRPVSQEERKPRLRRIVWVNPERDRCTLHAELDRKSSDVESAQFESLLDDELLKQFISEYLFLVGMLFTGIGFERFAKAQERMLSLLNALLSRESITLSKTFMLKVVALNIFTVEFIQRKQTQWAACNRPLSFVLTILACVVRKTNDHLVYMNLSDSSENMPRNLVKLLQFIKIMCDWFNMNPPFLDISQQLEHNTWTEMLKMSRLLSGKFKIAHSGHYKSFQLEEDLFLKGFTPLVNIKYTDSASENEFSLRLQVIVEFCHSLLQVNPTASNHSSSTQSKDTKLPSSLENRESADCTSKLENDAQSKHEFNDAHSQDSEILELSKLKRELERKTEMMRMYDDKFQQVLQDVNKSLYIEVHPKYLVPDTNCFIGSLDELEAITKQFKQYILIVPLIVVKELDGLSKGFNMESMRNLLTRNKGFHQFDEVSTVAEKSLKFIRNSKNVKCATTKGSILNSSTLFALEENESISNDDKILATAVALQEKDANCEISTDGTVLLRTEIVLITTDRNLRVKALAKNIIVSELKEFLKWAVDDKFQPTL